MSSKKSKAWADLAPAKSIAKGKGKKKKSQPQVPSEVEDGAKNKQKEQTECASAVVPPSTEGGLKKRKNKGEIDELFGTVKLENEQKRKEEERMLEEQRQREEALKSKKPPDDLIDGKGKRKKTDDGFLIYSVEEMNVGKGGDTPDCPFDCWCCY
mmetsp:Transcript_38584/g.46675  ORF Transcript_38584/g.46675 Transcript_38584/m.46675 type:complete len:155 (+) Transcript_38584:281-745(+)|eukprot:CAMPEP_0197850290 /NCGR_PEP_ID=MMETSP1438-20131217/14905_1 /TAXON_ID=1461541 /ORGANISM="Pterosperma sp., Strain CCMP1384" /LENGTH=154 /DNA_ID=CAMNT_0043463375 /DNA_START=152 /DNA_END=616 /DNA_ORIENTATION=-